MLLVGFKGIRWRCDHHGGRRGSLRRRGRASTARLSNHAMESIVVVQIALQRTAIHHFRHPIKVDQQAQKHLVGGGTVLVDPAQIAQDRDARHILPVKSKHAGGLLTQPGRAFGRRNMPVEVLVLTIVGRCNLGQQSRHHLDDICHRHGADLILLASFLSRSQRMPRSTRSSEDLLACKTLYVVQITDFDPAGRGGSRPIER